MRSRLLYGAAFFIASYCLSCKCSTKTIDCPGYQGTKLKNWFDYSDNQLLSFKTSSGEQKTFNLRNTLTTEPYQATSGYYSSSVSCGAEQRFESVEKDVLNRSKFSLDIYEYEDLRGRVIARVDSSILQFEDVISDTIRAIRINYVPAQGIFNNSVNLDNQSFSKVIEATIDTSNKKQAGIYKVYVAKQQGLVAYVEYPSLKLWVKQ